MQKANSRTLSRNNTYLKRPIVFINSRFNISSKAIKKQNEKKLPIFNKSNYNPSSKFVSKLSITKRSTKATKIQKNYYTKKEVFESFPIPKKSIFKKRKKNTNLF